MPKEDADWHEANDRQAIEAGRALEFEEHSQLNGRSIIWLTKKFPLHDPRGRIYAVAGISADISERKRVEENLSRQARLIDLSPDAVIVRGLDGRITFWAQGAATLYGYSREEAVGRISHELLQTRFPESKADITKQIKETGSWVGELIHLTKDGRKVVVQSRWLGQRNEQGKFTEVLESNIDITERKLAEEELKAAKQQAELYLDLMGHDINNMHQIALGYLELAREMPDSGVQGEFLDKSMEVLQRSTALIGNVRKLQKLQDGIYRMQDMDLSRLLRDVQKEYGSVPNKRITLHMNGHEHCMVRANELLHDVLANLVLNAIKHTGDKADILMMLDTVKDNNYRHCMVIVEDNGPGIPDEAKEHIFNRALRGTSKASGMGLGLYLVKSLVDSYGGKVWAEDRVHGDHTHGARFVVMLPAVDK
jgi:PAS domain S-box-containing protein